MMSLTARKNRESSSSSSPVVYLDNCSTTMESDASASASDRARKTCGNASNTHHASGRRAKELLRAARAVVASRTGFRPSGVLFTSGATESNHLGIRGLAMAQRAADPRRRVVLVNECEHKCALAACRHLADFDGFEVREVRPRAGTGIVEAEDVADAVRKAGSAAPGSAARVALITVMAVNNVLGTVNDVPAIAAAVKREDPGALVHVDAAQAPGKVESLKKAIAGADSVSLSAHKFGGPHGVGALLLRPGVRCAPLVEGGGQESGLRAGTENVPGIAGMAVALSEACRRRKRKEQLAEDKAEWLLAQLRASLESEGVRVLLLGDETRRVPHVLLLSFVFPGACNKRLLRYMDEHGVQASAASACDTKEKKASYVVRSLVRDLPEPEAKLVQAGSIRLCLSDKTTWLDVARAAHVIADGVREQKEQKKRRRGK